MSVLINMEMPENCADCFFGRNVSMSQRADFSHVHSYCCISSAEPSVTGLPNVCPLVEVPPHGDLIDRDKISYFKDDSNLLDFDYAYRSQINSIPTIIPAEEGET